MDISMYAAGPDSYDNLSAFQISQFFERHAPTTRDDCNRLAADILGSSVTPTPVQGTTSYTVSAIGSDQATKVVQFRSKMLDMELIGLARQSYGDFVPKCKTHSTMLGDVYVYVWDLVPGTAFCRVRRQFMTLDSEMEQRLFQTVSDFARSVGTCSTGIFID